MSKDITVRLATPAGRSRIVLPLTATFKDLQEDVKKRTGVEPAAQRFALDPKGQQPISGSPTAALASIGIVNGVQLHLVNQEASIAAQVLTKVAVSVEPEAPVKKGSEVAAAAPAANTSAASSSTAAPAGSSTSVAKAASGDALKVDPKFDSFDNYLKVRRWDTSSLTGGQRYISAKITRDGMIRIPPAVSIKQQPYRHVDNLSMINVEEIQNFIGYWTGHLLENAMQRFGYMYGYYLEDPNYPEGCRALVEGIYEPPQEMNGEMASALNDPHQARVDRIAEALGIEKIGWMFTTLPLEDGQLLSPTEVQRIARLQNEHSTDLHFSKYVLSKFVSCSVRPDTQNMGAPKLEPFMVCDQVCAMVRDGILCDSPDRKHCVVREAQKGELIPEFLAEGKPNKKILTDFFVVRVNDVAPKRHTKLFVHADFPRENRQTHPQRRDDLKQYFKKRPSSEPSWSRFADFHLLLFIAKALDVDTAVQLCECVRERQEVQEGTKMLFEALMG